LNEKNSSVYLKTYKKQNQYDEIWSKVFRLNKNSFKKGTKYTFNHMIKTDGISVSILFVRVDANGIPLKSSKLCNKIDNTKYIEDNIDKINNKRVVVADPNKSDLVYCGSYNSNNVLETFRYTQSQRKYETCERYYTSKTQKINKETLIDNKSVKELETELSLYNSKTIKFNKFMDYCIKKNEINYNLFEHYTLKHFRKVKLNIYTNTQKSESKLVKNFKEKFGSPNEAIFVIGDYDCGSYNMKNVEPAICKRFRKIFKDAGYDTYLINEYKTSKVCNECNGILEKYLEKNGSLCNGILRCKSNTHTSVIYHNRDKNAVRNMLRIINSLQSSGKKPEVFCRVCV
jgi:hypothetical protein